MSDAGDKKLTALFEILVHEHADMLESYLLALLPDAAAVDDIFQETMLVAWRRIEDYDRARPFGAWLRGIAQILILEHMRKAGKRPLTTDPQVLVEIDRRFDLLARTPGDTFLDRAERLITCIAHLPEAMREAIHLVYTRSLTVAAAAASLNTNTATFKKRLQRGRQLLAECLGIHEARP